MTWPIASVVIVTELSVVALLCVVLFLRRVKEEPSDLENDLKDLRGKVNALLLRGR